MPRRVVRVRFPLGCGPGPVFDALFSAAPNAFWLDDGPVSVLGAADDGTAPVTDAAYPQLRTVFSARAASGDGGIAPGWFGWLGYEWGAAAAGSPVAVDVSGVPPLALMRASRIVVVTCDAVELVTLSDDVGAQAWAADAISVLRGLPAPMREERMPEPPDAVAAPEPHWRHSDAGYLSLIADCRDAIARGDAYQLCLTNTATVDAAIDPVRLHRRLRRLSPAPHGGLVRLGDTALVSASPESFLAVTADGRVTTRPIKGTRPRAAGAADRRQAEALAADPKERAENVMIVDLMRNDLARVCAPGTVEVTGLLEVESHAQVHQLVSTVQGRLADGRDGLDAVAAAFPAGSMTGAPKASAMRLLHRLEGGARGVYAGCFGRFGVDGSVALAMVIRSAVVRPGTVTIGAGGGITALSDPHRELAEVKLKASVLLAAVEEVRVTLR